MLADDNINNFTIDYSRYNMELLMRHRIQIGILFLTLSSMVLLLLPEYSQNGTDVLIPIVSIMLIGFISSSILIKRSLTILHKNKLTDITTLKDGLFRVFEISLPIVEIITRGEDVEHYTRIRLKPKSAPIEIKCKLNEQIGELYEFTLYGRIVKTNNWLPLSDCLLNHRQGFILDELYL